ncbi:hypothetical protein NOF04DRAFT_1197408, partial [Fusarium oxysporum II5]
FFARHNIGRMAIIWALMTGDKTPQFACYGRLRTAILLPVGIVNQSSTRRRSAIISEPSTLMQVSPRPMDQIAANVLAS